MADKKTKIDEIIERIHSLEGDLEIEFAKRSAEMKSQIADFDKEMSVRYKAVRIGVFRYLKDANILFILTSPIIYSLIIPFALLDLMATIYQAICFPLYKIEKVKRKEYFNFDRAKLSYLNIIEKLNCTYCSYGNGVLAYVQEIAAKTEQYWCPIKHKEHLLGAHKYYRNFEEYGKGESYQKRLIELRDSLNKEIDANADYKSKKSK